MHRVLARPNIWWSRVQIGDKVEAEVVGTTESRLAKPVGALGVFDGAPAHLVLDAWVHMVGHDVHIARCIQPHSLGWREVCRLSDVDRKVKSLACAKLHPAEPLVSKVFVKPFIAEKYFGSSECHSSRHIVMVVFVHCCTYPCICHDPFRSLDGSLHCDTVEGLLFAIRILRSVSRCSRRRMCLFLTVKISLFYHRFNT